MSHAISTAGLALIQEYEGFRAEPTQLPDGSWVVGYGHVRVAEAGPSVSQAEASDLLALDLAPIERVVNALVTKPLTQGQFDALVSFTFSVGADAFASSQVLRRVNAGDFVAAACAMDAWRKTEVNGELEIVDALVRRRAAEKALFLKELPHDASPSVFMRAKLDHAASILGAPVKYAPAPVVGAVAVAVAQAPQFVETNIVELVQVATPPKFEPAVRLTEILKSEPATEALLLTQVANDFDESEEGEIVTAHAKPVARQFDNVREATRRAFEAQEAQRKSEKKGFLWFKSDNSNKIEAQTNFAPDRRIRELRAKEAVRDTKPSRFKLPTFNASVEHLGLSALLVFGLGLISLGGSLLFSGRGDMVEIVAAAAVVTPGLAATIMAAYGLWRTPRGAHA